MHIDHDAVVSGQIVVAGSVRLDGRCEGSISCTRLEIGRWGRLEGSVEADEVVVEGEMIGDIRARRVRLHATAVVEGDVTHGTLVVDGQAVLVGDSHHDEDARAPVSVRRLRDRAAAEDAELQSLERAARQRAVFVQGESRMASPAALD